MGGRIISYDPNRLQVFCKMVATVYPLLSKSQKNLRNQMQTWQSDWSWNEKICQPLALKNVCCKQRKC